MKAPLPRPKTRHVFLARQPRTFRSGRFKDNKPRKKSSIWDPIIRIITRARNRMATKSHPWPIHPSIQLKWNLNTTKAGPRLSAKSVRATDRYKLDRLFENFHHVETWDQYEILELLKQGVELAEVTIPWLESFREDLDLKV